MKLKSLVIVTLFIAINALEARGGKFVPASKPCKTKENCLRSKSCLCYCSEKGDFRAKILSGPNMDKPVFVENDPNGKFCYCKQWDLDNYPLAVRN